MREGYAFVTDAEQQVPVHSLRARGVTTLLADPLRLILRVVCDGYRFVLAALHGPHRATEHSAIDAWWSDTLSHLRRVSNGDQLLLGGDLNAALGSITTDQIGDLAAELEDTAGYWVRSLARDQRLCLPATFAAFHKGASHTYVQKKSHCLIRPDFLLVPQTWCVGQIGSWTDPCIHAGHAVQDHVAAIVDVLLFFRNTSRAETPAGPRLSAQALLDPDNQHRVRCVLESAPPVAWEISAHAHAAILTRHIQAGLAAISSDKATRPRHPYLTPGTFELQRAAARVRRDLHVRQRRLRLECLSACIAVWKGKAPSFEVEFLDNGHVRQLRLLATINAQQLGVYGRAIRQACRLDRNAYLSSLADQVSSGPSHEVFAAYHKILAHKRRKPPQADPYQSSLTLRDRPAPLRLP